jgi:predicted dehydrogenase
VLITSALAMLPCAHGRQDAPPSPVAGAPVRLITLDPGHFHAALVQKTMTDGVSPVVHVYAPEGPDVADHLRRIEAFNRREQDPTAWRQVVYTGDDFLERMLRERSGNVVVISGNNRRKADAIRTCAEAGLHVLADKPMCIDGEGFLAVRQALEAARRRGVIVYDIMTERSEITTILQKELMHSPSVFGELIRGTIDEPAVVKESVHHFFKLVAGSPIKRPPWYFDTTQQGEGIVDVTTHLVDLVLWACFPGEAIDADRDVEVLRARRWPTMITAGQFGTVTGLDGFPASLRGQLDDDGVLPCSANGAMDFTVRGVHVRISVAWAFEAPEGAGDTHHSVMRGTRASLVIRQGAGEGYRPELFVEPAPGVDGPELAAALADAIGDLQSRHPGVDVVETAKGWRITIPERYRIGHEAHFAEVMTRFLKFVDEGRLPDWEVANMLAKYATTTRALEKARQP